MRLKTPFFSSLSFKVKFLIFICVFISITGITLSHFFYERSAAAKREKEAFGIFSKEISQQIDEYLSRYRHLTNHLSLIPQIRQLPLAEISSREIERLNQILRQNVVLSEDYEAIMILNQKGICVSSSYRGFIGGNYSMREYFQEAMNGKNYASEWLVGVRTGIPGIFFSSPLYHSNKIKGVLVLKLKTDPIRKIIYSKNSLNLNLFLMNPMGVILIHTQPRLDYFSLVSLSKEQQKQIRAEKQFNDLEIKSVNLPQLEQGRLEALRSGETQLIEYTFEKNQRIAALTPLNFNQWVIGVSKNYEDIYAQSRIILFRAMIEALIFLFLASVAGFYLSHQITFPVASLSASVETFSSGKTKTRAQIFRRDEIGKLSESFNQMADSIERYTENLEQKVKERTQELSKSNQAKDILFSVISHDLIGPTGAYRELLRGILLDYDSLQKEEIKAYLEQIFSDTEKSYSLLENVLNWSRSQKDSLIFSPQSFLIHELIEEVISLLNSMAQAKDIQIRCFFSEPISVFADRDMTHLILRNLFSNAVKFSHRKSRIDIQVKKEADLSRVSIRDYGTGMSSEVLSALFQPEGVKSQYGTEGEKGTGLGLSLCRRFIQQNGGEIQIWSEEGQGTEITFSLPLDSEKRVQI